jgi:uncharacterized membrane protein
MRLRGNDGNFHKPEVLVENIQKFFQENPKYFGIVLIIAGISFLIYTIKTPSVLLLRNTTNRYRIKDFACFFGEKSGALAQKIFCVLLSICLMISGLVLLILGSSPD